MGVWHRSGFCSALRGARRSQPQGSTPRGRRESHRLPRPELWPRPVPLAALRLGLGPARLARRSRDRACRGTFGAGRAEAGRAEGTLTSAKTPPRGVPGAERSSLRGARFASWTGGLASAPAPESGVRGSPWRAGAPGLARELLLGPGARARAGGALWGARAGPEVPGALCSAEQPLVRFPAWVHVSVRTPGPQSRGYRRLP